jgi:hypothetical protein
MEAQPVAVSILRGLPPAVFEYYKRRGMNEEEIKALFASKTVINARPFHGFNPPSKPGGCGCGCNA